MCSNAQTDAVIEAEARVGVLVNGDVKVLDKEGKMWNECHCIVTKTRLYLSNPNDMIHQNKVGFGLMPQSLYLGEIPNIIFSYVGPASMVIAGLTTLSLELGPPCEETAQRSLQYNKDPLQLLDSSRGMHDLIGYQDEQMDSPNRVDDGSEDRENKKPRLLEILPDDARRSRHTALFPLRVSPVDRNHPVILATSSGKKMWEIAFAIHWRGDPPRSIIPRPIPSCMTFQRYPNPLWVDPHALQQQLLESLIMFLPGSQQLRVGSIIVRVSDNTEHEVTHIYEDGYIEVGDLDEEISVSDYRIVQEQNSNHQRDGMLRLDTVHKNAGKNFIGCLVSACIHGAEKNMEMLLSLELIDGEKAATEGNSPLSMCLEGKYTPERTSMAASLIHNGAVFPAAKAGYSYSSSLIYFLCKPARIKQGGLGPYATIGEAVHPEDKKLVKFLVEKGIGSEFDDEAKRRIADCYESGAAILDLSALATRTSRDRYSYWGTLGTDGLSNLPKTVVSLSNWLLEIDLSYNVITELPEEFFKLTCLKRANLSKNCLLEVSPKFKDLSNLVWLDISGNLVEKLPVDLQGMEALREVNCDDNPIKWPPKEIWERKDFDDKPGQVWSRLYNFLSQVVKSGQTENVSMKMMVVGRSECGKTSLINALLLNYSKLARKGDRTLGIEQRYWEIDTTNGRLPPLELSVFDFAGQDEYYATHHMYLTARALYIVAFDLSICENEEDTSEMVGFYLDLLQMRVGGSSPGVKVLVVGTHVDEIDAAVAKERCDMVLDFLRRREQLQVQHWHKESARLKKKMSVIFKSNTKGEKTNDAYVSRLHKQINTLEMKLKFRIKVPDEVYAISSASDMHGIPKFRHAVEMGVQDTTFFPQMHESIPLFYDQLRNYIRDQRGNIRYYSWKDHEESVRCKLGSALSTSAVKSATDFMHSLGELLLPAKSDTVFLNVPWLVDVMKLVIRHDHQETLFWKDDMDPQIESFMRNRLHFENQVKVRFIHHGELPLELLKYLWSDLKLDEETFCDLVWLLESFEVIVAVGPRCNNNGLPKNFLVPTFVPNKLVESSRWPAVCPKAQSQVVRIFSCEAASYPAAMMQRLQVLLCKKMSSSVMLAKNGTLASWNDNGVFLIEMKTPSQLQLSVRQKGNYQDLFKTLCELSDVLKRFFEQWPGMFVMEYAQYEQQKTGKVYLFRLDDLVHKIALGCKSVSCATDGAFVDGKPLNVETEKRANNESQKLPNDNVPIIELLGTTDIKATTTAWCKRKRNDSK